MTAETCGAGSPAWSSRSSSRMALIPPRVRADPFAARRSQALRASPQWVRAKARWYKPDQGTAVLLPRHDPAATPGAHGPSPNLSLPRRWVEALGSAIRLTAGALGRAEARHTCHPAACVSPTRAGETSGRAFSAQAVLLLRLEGRSASPSPPERPGTRSGRCSIGSKQRARPGRSKAPQLGTKCFPP